jgi:hypothetical protein
LHTFHKPLNSWGLRLLQWTLTSPGKFEIVWYMKITWW